MPSSAGFSFRSEAGSGVGLRGSSGSEDDDASDGGAVETSVGSLRCGGGGTGTLLIEVLLAVEFEFELELAVEVGEGVGES